MGHAYQALLWNRQKKIYDRLLALGVLGYVGVFVGLGAALFPDVTAETLIIRGVGTAAFLLLHIILSIGPLCRINSSFLPLLYNRRHMGVTMFLLALVHGVFSIIQFHVLGNVNPLVSLLSSNPDIGSLGNFPFQPLGFMALLIFFLMAATSHDFWLANLTPPIWKTLHMMVYIAYGLVITHVVLGVLQAETNPVYPLILGAGLVWVLGLHIIAGWREKPLDMQRYEADQQGFISVCKLEDIGEDRGHIALINDERIAVFKYDGKISAISNVCQHQNGPLGEGRVIDGLVTCPWHGYQYAPADGASPVPFTEKVPTFRVKLVGNEIFVHPDPNLPGTYVEPAVI